MEKKLKTLEQIKSEWTGNIVEHKSYFIRFYNTNGNLDSHITFKMKKYFGKKINVFKLYNDYYDWYIDNDDDDIWRFKDDWFLPDIESHLPDELFKI